MRCFRRAWLVVEHAHLFDHVTLHGNTLEIAQSGVVRSGNGTVEQGHLEGVKTNSIFETISFPNNAVLGIERTAPLLTFQQISELSSDGGATTGVKEGANKSYGTRAFTGNPLILND